MYSITDKESAINQVLEYLGLAKNGVFNERAREEVLIHQRRNGISESGVVDYITFNSLRDEYHANKARENARDGVILTPAFPYSFGDSGTDVARINSMLADVLSLYTTEGYIPRGAYFTRDSALAVTELRKIFRLPPGESVDEDFLVVLRREHGRIL